MRTLPKWVNKIHEADKIEFSSVHAVCFNPSGTQLLVGAGEKVMVYDPRDGALLQLLQAHRGAVHAVAYCSDGNKFASGSADKNVIIWTSKMEGVLKYSHSEAIQCLAYNPVSLQLASCGVSDFAFWSTDVKAVQKYKVAGRITSCAWSANGQHLAIGLASGVVSIREKSGDEVQKIIRDAAVWAVTFFKTTLLVTDWDETLSFYNLQGQQVHKERNIGIAAVSIGVLGSVVVVGGAGGWAALTAEGVPIASTPQDWVWAVAPSPASNTLAVGCQDGTLWCYQAAFSTVHALYRERYAYRENMTDVIVQHLTTGNKVRIKCHDRVHKIAIYRHRLAVQLPERVVVYEQGDGENICYRVREKLPQRSECSLLVATSDHLLLCQDTKLTMIGKRSPKSWQVPAPIRYVKVTTLGLQEALLLGLLNGQIWRVEPSSGGAQLLLTTPAGVRCLDVSASRGRLAVVDEASICRVYSLPKGDLLYTEENVSSVSWNAWCDELLCLSGGGRLSIRAGHFPPAAQPLAGSVVGFQGGRVFCLQANSMQTINVPLSHAVHQYVQQKMFSEAYAVACLGVTACDWERLGAAALDQLSLEVARNAFQRTHNFAFLTLIDQLQERLDDGEQSRAAAVGEVLALRGRPTEAARAFRAAGCDERALALYLDLRMFNKAQELAGSGAAQALVARRRAQWARHVSEPRAAAELYLAAGDVRRAAALMADCGRTEMLIELARKLDKGSIESLRHVGEALASAGDPAAAADVYQRVGDYKRVAALAVAAGDWARAFALARDHTDCRRDVYLMYAHQMAQQGKFVEAMKAYHLSGETAVAMRVFSILVSNALAEERYGDAGYLHHLLAQQCRQMADTEPHNRERHAREAAASGRLARVYHAYEAVHRSVHEPFSLGQPEPLLNAARYALALIDHQAPPPGVSMFCIYLCIAKQANTLNATSLASLILDKIVNLQIPPKFQESVELLMVLSRGAGGGAGDEVAPLCWRCRRHAPPLAAARCPHCRHPMAHSLASHEVLPLVELTPGEGISWEEAWELVERAPSAEPHGADHGPDVLTIQHEDNFNSALDEESGAVVCSREDLVRLNPAAVVAAPPALYRNMLPELAMLACPHCQNLFFSEDYEAQVVSRGHCPVCRRPEQASGGGDTSPTSPTDDSPDALDHW